MQLHRLKPVLHYVLAATLAWGVPAAAQDLSNGNGFLQMCERPDDWRAAVCVSYVMGLHQGMMAQYSAQAIICPPAGFTTRQGQDLLVGEILKKPGERHFRTAYIYTSLLLATYPCPSGSPPTIELGPRP